jgi:ABC-type transport system substrate-binding protein
MTDDYKSKYDALILQGVATSDLEERRNFYVEIQLDAQVDAVNVWLYQEVASTYLQEWIKGYYYNPAYFTTNPAYTWIYALSKEAP